MKLITTAVFCIAMFALNGSMAGESALNENHAEWASRVVYDNEQIRFRSVTTYAEAGNYVVLAMDRHPNKCDSQYAAMNVLSSTPSERSFTSDSFFGAIRVDEQPVHNMAYTLSFQKGERVFFVNVTNFDGEETLLSELRTGRYLRFKLKSGKDEYFLRFPLAGYAAAEQRTLSLCRTFNKGKSDEDYFKADPKAPKTKIKSDKSYF